MSQVIKAKVGKKNTIYIPKRVAEASGIKEGTSILIKAEKDRLEIEVVKDPISLATKGEKFARITFDEAERVSMEEQTEYEGAP